jgi:YD repeat-containing protein
VVNITGWLTRATQAARKSREPNQLGGFSRAGRRRKRATAFRGCGLGGGEQLESKFLLTVGIVQPIPAQVLPATINASSEILLADRFALQDVAGTVVRVNTNAPLQNSSFFVELFDNAAAAPERVTTATAENFLGYVDDGSFSRSIIHRSIPGFVIQGGGFTAPTAPANQPDGSPVAIGSKGTVVDEIGNPNQRGTIAMAKVAPPGAATVANSATSQWFVNLDDNSGLDAEFTAFGRVLGNGMTVINALAAATTWDVSEYYDNGALTNTPLWTVPGDAILQPENFVTFTGMSRATPGQMVSLAVTSANPDLLRAQLFGDRLILSRAGTLSGTTTVTVRASAAFDPTDFVEHSFEVTLPAVPPPPDVTIEAVGDVTLGYDPAGRVYANGTLVTSGGGPVNYHTYGSWGWTARAAETVGGINQIVWQNEAGSLQLWSLSASWAHQSSLGDYAVGTATFNAIEAAFGMDFNGDDAIGQPLTVIEAVGAVTLAYDPAGNLLANGTLVTSGGGAVNYHTYASWGWTARAAETFGSVNKIVWQNQADALQVWELSGSWDHRISLGDYADGTAAFNATEAAFGMDFDGDGQVAPATTLIESRGDVALEYDGSGNLRANGVLVTSGGGPVNYDTFRSWGWTARAAESVGRVNTIVWQNEAGELHFWRLSSGWLHENSEGDFGPGSPQYAVAEGDFGVDLSGDGRITIESAGGVSLWYDAAGILRANETLVTSAGNSVNYDLVRSWGWEAVAAEVVNTKHSIAWRNRTTGSLQYWRLDSGWAHRGSEADDLPGSPGHSQAELDFQVDFDRDGAIGAAVVEIESRGSVVLQRAGNGNLLANGVLVTSGDAPVNYFTFLSWGWTALAADVVEPGNTIAWRNSAGELHLWELNGDWAHERSRGNFAPGTPQFETARQALELDL